MSKNKFIKIISFLLSVPCFISNSSTEAARYTKKNICNLHNSDTRIGAVLRLFDLIKGDLTDNLNFSMNLKKELCDYKDWIENEDFDYNIQLYSDYSSFTIKPKSNIEKTFSFKTIHSNGHIEIEFFEPNSDFYRFYNFPYDFIRYNLTIRKLLNIICGKGKVLDRKSIYNFAQTHDLNKKIVSNVLSNNKGVYLKSKQHENRNSMVRKVIKLGDMKYKTQNSFYNKNSMFMKDNLDGKERKEKLNSFGPQSPLVRLDLYKDKDLSTTDNSLESYRKNYKKGDLTKQNKDIHGLIDFSKKNGIDLNATFYNSYYEKAKRNDLLKNKNPNTIKFEQNKNSTNNSTKNSRKKYEKRDLTKYKNTNPHIFSNKYCSRENIDLSGENSQITANNVGSNKKIYKKRIIT